MQQLLHSRQLLTPTLLQSPDSKQLQLPQLWHRCSREQLLLQSSLTLNNSNNNNNNSSSSNSSNLHQLLTVETLQVVAVGFGVQS